MSGKLDPAPAFDFQYLDHQTGGDTELEAELLALFEGQMRQILTALNDAADRLRRRDLAHKLRGSARALGAAGIGDAAEALELALRENAAAKTIGRLVDEVSLEAARAEAAIAGRRRRA